MKKNKWKYSGLSLLITVFFLAGIVLLNVLAGMLTDRFFLKADLTDTGLYSLSEEAAGVLSGVGETVDIIVLAEESTWIADSSGLRTPIIDILQNYSAETGGRLRIQYVNPELNSFNGPDFNNSLSELKAAYNELDGMTGDDIIFKSARRAARVPVSTLYSYTYDAYGNTVPALRADQELINALLYVLSEQVAKAVFIEGHREDPADYLQVMLDRSGYICTALDLSLSDIPDDATIVISAAPKADFLPEEVIKLENYLLSGGNAMIFYDYETLSLPRLDAFLKVWGITVESRLVLDDQYSSYDPYSQALYIRALVKAGSLPSLAGYETAGAYVGMPRPRAIRCEWAGGIQGRFTAYPLIQTYSASSYAKDYGSGDLTTYARESGDESGPFVLGYDVCLTGYDADSKLIRSHLIVTSAGLIDDLFLYVYGGNFDNISLIIELVNDLNPFGQNLYIPAKLLGGSVMPVTGGQARAVLILMVIALPSAIILAGVFVWHKRRHQ